MGALEVVGLSVLSTVITIAVLKKFGPKWRRFKEAWHNSSEH